MDDHNNSMATEAGDDMTGQAASSASAHDRRDALRKIGRYSAYAAPALMALLSNKAAAAS